MVHELARLARRDDDGAQPVGSVKPGTPPPDMRQWLIDNGLFYGDFGISWAEWVKEPAGRAREGLGFGRDAIGGE